MLAGIVCCALVIAFLVHRLRDPLLALEPISDEELLLLSMVDEKHYAALLRYVRTMDMSPELQEHLADKGDALGAISYYMLLQTARQEEEKKRAWQREQQVVGPKSHIERMILQRLGR